MYNVGSIFGPFFAGPCAYGHVPLSRPIVINFTRSQGPLRSPCWHGHGWLDYLHRNCICIGTAVIATSAHASQFIAGRFILGFGTSFMTCAAPSYVIEIAPPRWRSRFAAFYNCDSAPSIDPWTIVDAPRQVGGSVVALPQLLLSSVPRRLRVVGGGGFP